MLEGLLLLHSVYGDEPREMISRVFAWGLQASSAPRLDLFIARAAYALPRLRGARTSPVCYEVDHAGALSTVAMAAPSPDQSCQSTVEQGCPAVPGCGGESSQTKVAR